MSTITLRATKGSPLTNSEIDANFTNLNNDKLEAAGITFEVLDANSDVGSGATQLAQGDHSHSNAVIKTAYEANANTNEFSDAEQTKLADNVGVTNVKLNTKVIDIGDWDMDIFTSKTFAHGLTLSKIRSVTAMVRTDADADYYDINYGHTTGTSGQGGVTVDATNVQLLRFANGFFDTVSFDSTSFNRGWVTIQYTD